MQGQISFGVELKRQRMRAGLSLADMEKLVFYSKSHLSKVENGIKPPSVELARQCDTLLGCDGHLIRLAGTPSPQPSDAGAPEGGNQWRLTLDPSGAFSFDVANRIEDLPESYRFRATTGIDLGARRDPGADHGPTLAHFRTMLDSFRDLGQRLGSEIVTPALVAQTHALQVIGQRAHGADRRNAFLLAARFAEFAGWMIQEAGDDAWAMWWTDRAVELAAAGDDPGMAAYAYVRRALITMYRQDASQTIALARRAQAAPCSNRIKGLAAQREAQGHALAGDGKSFLSGMDRARALLSADGGDGTPILGTSHIADPVALAIGWSLLDLGQPKRSAEVLREEIARLPAHACRTKARYGARLALSLARSAQLDEACVVAHRALDDYQQVRSATIRLDLEALVGTLRRWHRHPGAGGVGLRLTSVLHGGV